VSSRGLRRGQVNFRSHNSCLSLGAPFPGRRRACVLFGVFFRGGYSPTGLPGDTVWLALPPTAWNGLSVISHKASVPDWVIPACSLPPAPHTTEQQRTHESFIWVALLRGLYWILRVCARFCIAGVAGCDRFCIEPPHQPRGSKVCGIRHYWPCSC